MKLIRQGDLVLRRIGDAQSTEQPTDQTLAVGKQSGHSHVVRGVVVQELAPSIVGLVDVPTLADLRVAGMPWRHDKIQLPSGRYEYWIQREVGPDDEVRNVVD